MKNGSNVSLSVPLKKKKIFFLFLSTFFYCLGPILNSYSSFIDFIFFTSILLTLYFVIKIKKFPPPYIKIFWSFIAVFFYLIVSAAFYDDVQLFDFLRLSLKPVRIIATVIGGFALVLIFLRSGHSTNLVYLFIFLSISLHAIVMIIQLYSPEFRDLIYFYTINSSLKIETYYYEYNFRMGGLAGGFGSSTLSVTQAFGVILLPFVNNGRIFWQRWFLNLCALIIFFSVIICGRSGLLFILLFFPLSVGLATGNFSIRSASKVIIFSLALFGLLLGMIALIGNLNGTSDIFRSLTRSFDTYIAISEGGELQDKTVNALLKHWILPIRPEIFVLGSAEFLINTHFERTLNSDVGYIRNLWGMGIFISVVYWLPYFYFFAVGLLNLRRYDSAKILSIIALVTIILHSKEDVFYSRILLSYFALILGVFYFEAFPRNKYVRN